MREAHRWFCTGQSRIVQIASSILLISTALILFCSVALPGRRSSALNLVPRSSKRHALLDAATVDEIGSGQVAISNHRSLERWLTYISDPQAANKLGCPLDHDLACFYRFQLVGEDIQAPSEGKLVSEEDCAGLFKPIPSDHGRPWCIREGREPQWLRHLIPEDHCQQQSGPVLLTGKLDSPNPTHQANLHFLPIWKWAQSLGLKPGQLSIIVDHTDPAWAPGKFGSGLARALGNITWLPQFEPGLVQFEQIQFSIPGGELFPFDLKHRTIDTEMDLDFLELAENVKARIGPPLWSSGKPSDPSWRSEVLSEVRQTSASPAELFNGRRPRVVVAKRKEEESRIWDNAQEFADYLQSELDFDSEVVTLGNLSFEDQVKVAGSADVLVGITGSDLVNLMFLPVDGSVVEIFPFYKTEEVFVPELGNMAAMLGKNHFTYVTSGKIELNEGESRLLYRTKRINVAIPDLAALVSHAARQAMTGSSLRYHKCHNFDGIVRCLLHTSD